MRRYQTTRRLLGVLVVAAVAALLPAAPASAATGVTVAVESPPDPILPGQTVKVSVTATNNTAVESVAGTFTVRRPKSLYTGTTLTAIGAAGSCTTSAPRTSSYRTSTCPRPVIAPGATVVIATIKVVAPSSVPYGGINIPTTVTGPDNAVSLTFHIRGVGPADLVPNLTMTPNPAMIGQAISATASLNNWGYSNAPSFASRVTLPAGLSGLILTSTAGTSCTVSANTVDCATGGMLAGGNVIITMTFAAPATGGAFTSTFVTDIDNTVTEANETNNSANRQLTVNGTAANLVTSSTNPGAPVPRGSVFTRVVSVTNIGEAPAAGVILTDKFIAPFGYVGASGPTGTSCAAWYLTMRFNRKVFNGATCQLGTIPAGGSVSIAIQVSVASTAAAGTHTDTVNATTTSFKDPSMNALATGTVTIYIPATPLSPTNTVLPVLTGVAVQGNPLITTSGTWVGTTPSYTYRWQRCDALGSSCGDIAGATAATYVIQAADVTATLRSVVTATNSGGSTEAASVPTAVVTAPTVPVNTAAPVLVRGLEKQPGFAWGVTNGTWTGSAPITYTYQWQRCDLDGLNCIDIAGATNASYVLTDLDVFHTVRVRVTASNSGGSASSFTAVSGEIDPPDIPGE